MKARREPADFHVTGECNAYCHGEVHAALAHTNASDVDLEILRRNLNVQLRRQHRGVYVLEMREAPEAPDATDAAKQQVLVLGTGPVDLAQLTRGLLLLVCSRDPADADLAALVAGGR